MSHLKTGFLALAFAVAAGSAFAADDAMKSDAMKSDAMKMSAHDSKMMASCSAMRHDAMTKNKACAKVMKAHPDAMKSEGAMSH